MTGDGLPTPENPGRLASAAAIANPFQAALSAATAARKAAGKRAPKLVGILATPSPPSVAYAEWTKKACEAVGIEFEIWRTWDEAAQDEPMDGNTPKPEGKGEAAEPAAEQKPDMELEGDVEDLIIAANASDDVHGIMVYYPIFGGRQDTYLQQIVDPRKDVEGLHFSYCWNMYHNVRWILPSQLGGAPGTTSEPQAVNASPSEARRPSVSGGTDEVVPAGFAKSILPCTPLAVVKCLEALGVYDHSLPYGDRLYGKTITIVNRSEVVGRPLAALLSNDGAKVYSVDLGSVQEFNKRAPDDGQADDVHSAGGRTRSSVVLAARKANSSRRLRPHHVVRPCSMDLQGCVGASNVIISGVPSANFKIPTDWVPRGATTVNFSSEKNFEKDVRTRAACHLPAIGKTTIAMLQRNLLRLVDYREQGDAQGFGAPSQRGDGPDGPRGPGGPGGRGGPGGPGSGAPRPGQGDAPGPNGSDPRGGQQPPPSRDGGSSSNGGPDSGNAPTGSRQAAAFLAAAPTSQPSWKTSSETSLGRSLSSRADEMQIDPPIQTALARGRASTLSIPRPASSRERFSASTLHSPTYPVSQMGSSFGSSSAATTSSSLWDWRRSRRDSVASGTTTYSSLDCPSPTTGPSHCSPLLFAPVGASRQAPSVAHSSRSVSSHHYMSSPGTPMSPLFMDGLSVEDAPHGVPGTAHADGREHGPSVLDRPIIARREAPGRTYRSSTFSSPDSHSLLLERSPYQTLSGLAATAASETASVRQAQEAADSQRDQTQSDPAAAAPVGDRFASSRRRRRPPYSYSSLIAQAIASSPEGRMTLREIYTWISTSLPHLYSMEGPEHQGWQNTVRHNLSLNKSFVKVARTAQDIYESCASGNPSLSQAARGKGGWWTLDVPVAQALLGPNYKGEEDGDSGNEDAAATGPGGRPPRRRRTSSFAPVAGSMEVSEEARPKTVDGPSVLARVPDSPPAASRIAGPAPAAGVPSVLQRPRTQSMEVQDVAEHLALMQHQQQQQLQLQQQQAAARPLTAHSGTRSSFQGAPLALMPAAAQQSGRARGMTTSVVDEQRAGLPRHLRLGHAAAPSHAPPMPSVPPHSPLYGHFAAQAGMPLASPSKRKHILERDELERYERSPLASRSDLPTHFDDDDDDEMHTQPPPAKHSTLQEPRSSAVREETPLASREPVRSSGMSIRDLLNS